MMHELINMDNPRCLYCEGDIDFSHTSSSDLANGTRSDVEALTCRFCEERFLIYYSQNSIGETKHTGFAFSCNDCFISYNYNLCNFSIFDQHRWFITTIPYFTIDFSDKNKLYNKLKIYLVFS
jgi:hypothetical protein